MRISILPDDPGYDPDIRAQVKRYDVFLDDVPQAGVLTADDEAGLIVAYQQDGDGGWRHAGGELIRYEIRGVVRIEAR